MKLSDERNGCFLDSQGCCKVCDGEIPSGHTENCDIWKLEKEIMRLKTIIENRSGGYQPLTTVNNPLPPPKRP